MIIDERIRESIYNAFGVDLSLEENSLHIIIKKLTSKEDLHESEVVIAMSSLMSSDIAHADIEAYLVALHKKGETEEEIATSARVMRIFASKIYTDHNKAKFKDINIVDCCGTGGGANVFNVSTAVALMLAANGLYVAKHGNRAITSLSGSADVLEVLGVKIDIPASKVGECILQARIGFLFAPLFHQATKNVQQVRRKLKHKTIFNILGPLTNPAEPTYQLIGVYDPALTEKMARVLKLLNVKKAVVVHGHTPCGTGLDEVSTVGKTKVSELSTTGDIKNYLFSPAEVSLKQTSLDELRGGNATCNASIIKAIVQDKCRGPKADIVALNAAFAFMACDCVNTIDDGLRLSNEIIADKKADTLLENFIKCTNGMK